MPEIGFNAVFTSCTGYFSAKSEKILPLLSASTGCKTSIQLFLQLEYINEKRLCSISSFCLLCFSLWCFFLWLRGISGNLIESHLLMLITSGLGSTWRINWSCGSWRHFLIRSWYPECRRRDSNPHSLRHTPLKRACLPISPLRPKKTGAQDWIRTSTP